MSAPIRADFRALGTYVHLQGPGDLEAAQRRAAQILDAVDRACSRFRPDSDLSQVNAAPGSWRVVSRLLIAALRVAVDAARHTDGILDPCLGKTLIELGYDVDFDQVRRRPDIRMIAPTSPSYGLWRQIDIEDEAVRIPAGTSLDLGATAKAWASDLVAHSLAQESGEPVLVSVGGDVSMVDPQGPGTIWPIDITELPSDIAPDQEPTRIWVGSGGLTTSSTQVRRWRAGGLVRHHLIDPRTGLPSDGPWRTATATGPSCVAANTASTAALILGYLAPDWLETRGVSARLIAQDGTTRTTGDWPVSSTKGAACSQH